MAKIITENFKIETTNELFKSFQSQNSTLSDNFRRNLDTFNGADGTLNIATNDATTIQGFVDAELTALRPESEYYIMASTSLTSSEATTSLPIQNTQKSKGDFLRKILFGVKVDSLVARYMFYENQWVTGTVYDAYDDTKDIETQNTIVTVASENGEYLVYKCLENGAGSPSTASLPTAIDSPNYQIVQVADNYVWHYMFTVSSAEASVYRTVGSLPLPEPEPGIYGNKSVVDSAKERVSQIIIENTLSGQFGQFLFGDATSIDNASDVSIVNPEGAGSTATIKTVVVQTTSKPGRQLYDTANAYKDMYLRNSITGKLYNVKTSSSDVPSNQITLTVEIVTGQVIDSSVLHQLLPKIVVSSPALGATTARAYGILDQAGTLSRIGYENTGDNYKTAEAYVAYPPPLRLDSGKTDPAILRVIVSPKGGHGFNPRAEMAMSRLAVVANFSGESTDIPDANTYSQVGLIKNPSFTSTTTPLEFDNRTQIVLSGDKSSDIVADRFVEQYVRTVPVQSMINTNEYVISDLGTMTAIQWASLGVTGIPAPGKTFTASFSIIQSDFNGKVSEALDITQYDAFSDQDEIVKAKVHEVVVVALDPSSPEVLTTTIRLAHYSGAFKNSIIPGNLYTKTVESASVPTSVITINSFSEITKGAYVPYSGELLHFINFAPIPRLEGQREKVKFTFDF